MRTKGGIDFAKLRRYSLKERFSKVETSLFARVVTGDSLKFRDFLEALPGTLRAKDFRELTGVLGDIVRSGRTFVFAMGGHVIKVGLSPMVNDMIREGYISHVVMNGSGMIHDFEIALNAATSERVDTAIEDGSFGMAFETGKMINEAIIDPGKGLGYNLGRFISEGDFENRALSILATCYEKNIPATVHVAFGTDIIHYHPEFNPEKTGRATHEDFRKFIETVSGLERGAFLNFGSAVIIPEVFLKAIAVVRNLGYELKEIFTANFDFTHQYREAMNIVKRPTSLGGKGYYFLGHHEIMLPLLYASLKENLRNSE